jgi:hypothetical protein
VGGKETNEISEPKIKEWLESLKASQTQKHHIKGIEYFKEFSGKNAEDILAERKEKGKQYSTVVMQFFKWLQDVKKLSENSARSYIISLQAYLGFWEMPIRTDLSSTKMKVQNVNFTLENLQTIYKMANLEGKFIISLLRDCPLRCGDIVKKVLPLLPKEQFEIMSQKETTLVRCFISQQTISLYNNMVRMGKVMPKSKRYVEKILKMASQTCNLPDLTPHYFRKRFFSNGVSLDVNEVTLKILLAKSVPKDILTYYLESNGRLKDAWLKIVNETPLESVPNQNHANHEKIEDLDKVIEALATVISDYQKNRTTRLVASAKKHTELDNALETIQTYLKERGKTEPKNKAWTMLKDKKKA